MIEVMKRFEQALRDTCDAGIDARQRREAAVDCIEYLAELLRQETENTFYCRWCSGYPEKLGERCKHADDCGADHAVQLVHQIVQR